MIQSKTFFAAEDMYTDAQAAYFDASDANRSAAHAAFVAAADNFHRVCEQRPRAPSMLGCLIVGHECGHEST
jgi:hypothetical protein